MRELSTTKLFTIPVVLLLLFVFSYCTNAQLSDQEGSGGSGIYMSNSGDGESSGSGDDEKTVDTVNPPAVRQCAVSAINYTDAVLDEHDAILHIQCRSACLGKVLENDTQYQVSLVEKSSDFYTTISDESLQSNCGIYQKVYECIAGCRMAKTDRPSCSSNCFDRCETSGNTLPDSSCLVSCSRTICNFGCQLYDHLTIIQGQSSAVPVIPTSYSLSVSQYSSPYLHVSGAFSVTFHTNDSAMMADAITGFLVKLIVNDTTSYYTMFSFNDVLLIDPSFGCSDASIEFIPINVYGPSDSPLTINTTVHIYGEVYPLWPDHIHSGLLQYSMTDDDRDGYWYHAVISLEWSYPHRLEYLNSFTIQIKSFDEFACGKSVNISNIIDVSYEWKAQTPGDGPLSGCEYHIKVLSNPHDATFPGSPDHVKVHVNTTSNPVPEGYTAPIDINCYLKQPIGNFIHYMPRLEWRVSSNPHLLQGVKGFRVGLYGYTGHSNAVILRKDTVVPLNGASYKNSTTLDMLNVSSYTELVHELTVIYEDGFHGNTYFNTSTQSCTFYVTPPPSVSTVSVNDMFVDKNTNSLHVDVSWNDVLFGGDSVNIYNVYIGHTIQYNYTSTIPLNGVQYCVKSTQSFIKDFNSSFGLSGSQLVYVQVQSVNFLGLTGQWSDPYIFNPLTSVFQANLQLSCGRSIVLIRGVASTTQSFNFYVDWNINGLTLPGLDYFDVHLDEVDVDEVNGNQIAPLTNNRIYYEASKAEYSNLFTGVVIVLSGSVDYYIMKVKSIFKKGFPNREGLVLDECYVTGRPQPPDVVDKSLIKMKEFTINSRGQMNISMEWEEPESYGGIKTYSVYIGTAPLDGNGHPMEYISIHEHLESPSYDQVDRLVYEALLEEPENDTVSWTFYIQIQAINNLDAGSNWSLPLIHTMDPLVLIPAPTSSSTASVPVTSSPTDKTDTDPAIDPYRKLVPVLSSIIPIIFVLVLAIILVSILLLVAYCQKRKRTRKTEKALKISLGKAMMSNPGYVWERYHNDVEKLTLIGEGNFGDVYKGILRQMPEIGLGKKYCDESTTVFVSSLKASCSDEERRRFANCIEKYKMLAVLEHPFFLTFEGCVVSGEPYYVFAEYVENGDLLSFLQNHKKRIFDEQTKSTSAPLPQQLTSQFHQHPTTTRLYPVDLLNYARQISSAMDCLAGIHVVHGDLACRNIYLDQNFNVKVADFGIVANGHREVIYVNGLPIRWFAPEVLTDHNFTIASDVWSFGVTVWEIISLGDFPYQEIRNNDLLDALLAGQRLQRPKNCTLKFYDIISSCWKSSPHQRPSFESLHETFLDLLAQNQASSLLTLDLSQPDKPHPLETSTLKGAQSPISIDSAINDELDFGIAISKGGKLISACNPGYRSDSISYPASSEPQHIGSGFTNLGFRRSSMKSVDLDSPCIQISRAKPRLPHSTPTEADTSEDIATQIQQLPLPPSTSGHDSSSNASTEV